MKNIFIFGFFTIVALPVFGNNLAIPCYGCHGPKGVSPGETIPSSVGLDKLYLENSLNEYKSGIRDNYIMKIISNGYSDKEIKELASFFSKLDKVND